MTSRMPAASAVGRPADSPGLLTFGETMGVVIADQPGHLGTVRSFGVGVGGAESNVAMAVARLGLPATWIGRVGPDAVGELVERRVSAAGVHTVAIQDGSFTGIMVRHKPVGATTHVDYHRAGSAGSHLGPEDVGEDLIRAAGVLHVTGITPALSDSAGAAVRRAVEAAAAAGVPVSLDVNYRSKLWSAQTARPVLRELVRRADIVFAGVDEAQLVLDAAPAEASALMRGLAALGPREVVIKDGARGCTALLDGVELAEPAVTVMVVDPVGAGDAFVAGYLAERLAGAGPADRLRLAVASGAYAVGVPGDCESVPRREQLDVLARASADPEVVR
jgi:2-dehydro-3-deoxygluconokinase